MAAARLERGTRCLVQHPRRLDLAQAKRRVRQLRPHDRLQTGIRGRGHCLLRCRHRGAGQGLALLRQRPGAQRQRLIRRPELVRGTPVRHDRVQPFQGLARLTVDLGRLRQSQQRLMRPVVVLRTVRLRDDRAGAREQLFGGGRGLLPGATLGRRGRQGGQSHPVPQRLSRLGGRGRLLPELR